MLETSADGITYTPVKNFGTVDAPIKSALTSGMQYFNIVNEDVQYIRYTGDAGVSDIKVYGEKEPDIVTGEVETVTGTLLAQSSISVVEEETDYVTYGGESAIDGKTDTYWQSSSGDSTGNNLYKKKLTLDLGELKTISDIGITWPQTNRKYYFCIQTSTDGETWSYIDNMGTDDSTDNMINSEQTTTKYYCLGNVEARYIRYIGLGSSRSGSAGKYNQVCEFNVYVK